MQDTEFKIKKYDRRQFISRSLKAGVSIAAACALGYGFYDPDGPKALSETPEAQPFPDFSVAGTKDRICMVKEGDRTKALGLAVEAMGGIENFIRKGDRVLLKVNAAFASPPILSATTHPLLVAEMTRLCFKAGAREVVVTDNPINDPKTCFFLTGIGKAAEDAGARVILPREALFKPMTVPGAALIRNWPVLSEPFRGIDKVIGIAPVKDHHRSGASMTLKNWYGLLGGRRNIFHQKIHDIIMELSMMIRPTLVILDGTTTMVTNGPTGGSLSDLKTTNTLIVSTDPVAADACGAALLGKSVQDLPYIAKAEAAGAGKADYRSLNFKSL